MGQEQPGAAGGLPLHGRTAMSRTPSFPASVPSPSPPLFPCSLWRRVRLLPVHHRRLASLQPHVCARGRSTDADRCAVLIAHDACLPACSHASLPGSSAHLSRSSPLRLRLRASAAQACPPPASTPLWSESPASRWATPAPWASSAGAPHQRLLLLLCCSLLRLRRDALLLGVVADPLLCSSLNPRARSFTPNVCNAIKGGLSSSTFFYAGGYWLLALWGLSMLGCWALRAYTPRVDKPYVGHVE